MSVLSLSYQESDVTITNISHSLSHIMAGKHLGKVRYEEIMSLSPHVLDMGIPAPLCFQQGTDTPFTRYNRLYNRFDNRLYRVDKHRTGGQTGLCNRFENGLTTSCIV